MNLFRTKSSSIPTADEALPGRDEPIPVPELHEVLGRPLLPPFPDGVDYLLVGMGCFWGAERIFWETPGVWTTSVGYAGGHTKNPTYREVCSGNTGHTEAVLVAYETDKLSAADVLRIFWEGHDPTQGMRQGNDAGTQYRSIILVADDAERRTAEASRDAYAERLGAAGYGAITTEIVDAASAPFYYAEDYHQQYLAKNPGGYCPDHSTGVSCPVGLGVSG
jgi:peptide-methionine (S)-S-oxide reductase